MQCLLILLGFNVILTPILASIRQDRFGKLLTGVTFSDEILHAPVTVRNITECAQKTLQQFRYAFVLTGGSTCRPLTTFPAINLLCPPPRCWFAKPKEHKVVPSPESTLYFRLSDPGVPGNILHTSDFYNADVYLVRMNYTETTFAEAQANSCGNHGLTLFFPTNLHLVLKKLNNTGVWWEASDQINEGQFLTSAGADLTDTVKNFGPTFDNRDDLDCVALLSDGNYYAVNCEEKYISQCNGFIMYDQLRHDDESTTPA